MSFERPTNPSRLRYDVLYAPKPFPDAVLLYYANGVSMRSCLRVKTITVPMFWTAPSAIRPIPRISSRCRRRNVPALTETFVPADNPVADPTTLTWGRGRQLGLSVGDSGPCS